MNELLAFWPDWVRPSAGLPTLQWSLLLAVAAAAGHLVQRHTGMPKVLGYAVVGAFAGLCGFSGAAWPLQGIGLFILELGVAVVLFEAGGRIPLRWFRHNPMVLAQSLLESLLTYAAVFCLLLWLDIQSPVAEALAIIAIVASPAVLSRVVSDTRASGPVTERAIVLATLGSLYALTWGSAKVGPLTGPAASFYDTVYPVLVVLGLSIVVGSVLALSLRIALRVMSPTSENTSMMVLALIAAGTAVASHSGGSAPLAALLGGILLKQLNPRPWTWPRQLGTAASILTTLTFVLVSVVAAQADWSQSVAGVVLAVVGIRALAKVIGVGLANPGSGTSWRQAIWVGCAMAPMSSVALLLVSQFVLNSPEHGSGIASIALPAILMMEVLGAAIATFAIYRAGESSKPWLPPSAPSNSEAQSRTANTNGT